MCLFQISFSRKVLNIDQRQYACYRICTRLLLVGNLHCASHYWYFFCPKKFKKGPLKDLENWCSTVLWFFSFIFLQGTNHNVPLKVLVLNGCSTLSDELVLRFSTVLRNLQELDLSSCLHVTDIGLSAITGSLIQLQSLRLSWCINITDSGLIGFVQSEQNLAHVCHNKDKCSHAEKFKKDVKTTASQVCVSLHILENNKEMSVQGSLI